MEHENVIVIVRPQHAKKCLRDLAGTLTHEEAKEMQSIIDGDQEKREIVGW